LLDNVGIELALILFLMALLGFRFRVTPSASLHVAAQPANVYALLRPHDGKVQEYGRTRITAELADPASETYRFNYRTTTSTGASHASTALFRIEAKEPPRLIDWRRAGIEGQSENNQLLRMLIEITPEGDGCRFRQTYFWGPRPLLAQVLARADLLGGMYRLKSLAETGQASEVAHYVINAGVALVTGAISLAAFALMLGWQLSLLLIIALAVHEFGHLFAYKLIGQPWGRLMFLPFLGAIAVPRLPFHTQAEAVFAALMGPGLSVLAALGLTLLTMNSEMLSPWIIWSGLIVTGLNIFNLLPVEPLDGGMALRSVLAKLIGNHARFGLMAVGVLIIGVGYATDMLALMIFGGISILANLKPRAIDTGLTPLTSLQVCISAFSYVSIVAAYLAMFRYFLSLLH
jgi:Zn-dependent protease